MLVPLSIDLILFPYFIQMYFLLFSYFIQMYFMTKIMIVRATSIRVKLG